MALVDIRTVIDTLDKTKTYKGYARDNLGITWYGVQYSYYAGGRTWTLRSLMTTREQGVYLLAVDTLEEAQECEWKTGMEWKMGAELVSETGQHLFLNWAYSPLIEIEDGLPPITEEMYF